MKIKQDFQQKHIWIMVGLMFLFSIIGFILSLWFGLGWFILFFGIPRIVISNPRIHFSVVRRLFGGEIAEIEINRYGGYKKSWGSYAITLFWLILIFTVFLNYNVPLLKY